MKRKDYQKPTMRLVQLHHRTHLLHTSDPPKMNKNDDYEDGGDVLNF